MSNPGLLNRRLTLEAPVESADGAGGLMRSFESVATLWAQVTPVSAARTLEAERLGARVTHRIGIRFADDITTMHRFRDGARIFRIVSLRDRDGRRRFLSIEAEEIVP
ncbi:phage head closure protein [Pseudorhodoplanes sp.]|uniref:phage head closure protein n=1 Tax=Pseudorhodoplanes sp. TaxID=1934341 RepID=UPI003D14037B